MILFDFSSLIHRAVFTSIKNTNPHKRDGKYITDEYISITIYRIIEELNNVFREHRRVYGDLVICLDDYTKKYWRKDVYPEYKANRAKTRQESEVNYTEVYKHINALTLILHNFTPYKCIMVDSAEADDVIGVLCKKYARHEKILIYSPDKDFKQLHTLGDIQQYSSLTNSWIEVDDVDAWKIKHCALGDASDNVPKITEFSEFTDEFKMFLQEHSLDYDELQFYKLPYDEQNSIKESYQGDVYKKTLFGEKTLQKKIEKYGSIENFLNTNEIYKLNYERNKILVLDENIPPQVEADIVSHYVNAKTDFNLAKIKKYFEFYKLKSCVLDFQILKNEMADIIEMNEYNVDFSKTDIPSYSSYQDDDYIIPF